MKVFKFGGASVKDAENVKNVALVLENQSFEQCLLVVSAMGKTTNALEKIVELYFQKTSYHNEVTEIKQYHIAIAEGLFQKNHPIFDEISIFFDDMESFLRRNKSPNYNFVYDQVVSCGEMISSKIISEYLNDLQYQNDWIDARDYIKTDNTYREGAIHWDITSQKIAELDKQKCFVTQGFIGSDDNSFTVTLGREGSDYSAAIFAYCLDAVSMTIWKDVPGVMTGDPRKFENVKLLSNISYEEAIEMAYYGASVIHPKTLQPLQQKNIPFYVKSFLHPKDAGTKIGNSDINQNEESYILKDNQILLHIDTKDFSFIAEEHISEIFSYLAKYKIKVSLIQNSAISLAICIEDKYGNQNLLKQDLKSKFNIEIYENVNLFTVRNVNLENMEKFYKNKTILLEQLSKKTLQMITQS